MDKGIRHHQYATRVALGLRLKNWRVKENRKIADAASLLGVSSSAWGHWETGERLPSGELLLAIQNLTDIPLHVLFCPHLDACPRACNGEWPSKDDPCCHGRECHPSVTNGYR